jgi:hypothetical protein
VGGHLICREGQIFLSICRSTLLASLILSYDNFKSSKDNSNRSWGHKRLGLVRLVAFAKVFKLQHKHGTFRSKLLILLTKDSRKRFSLHRQRFKPTGRRSKRHSEPDSVRNNRRLKHNKLE